MLEERESLGFLGYKYHPSHHFLRPIMPDGSPSELIDGENLYHELLTLKTFPGCEKMFDDYILPFTSGGTHEVLAADTLTGATSGATCVVESVFVESGTWAGGDAAGYFFVNTISGTFEAENLNEGVNNNVCTIAAAPTEAQLGSSGKRTCVGVFPYVYSDGTIYLILCYPDKIYSYKAGDTSPTEITGSVTLTGTNTNYFDATYWADTSSGYDPWIVLTNGVDNPVYWDGTGDLAALGGSPPVGKYIDSFAGHLFISNITSGGVEYTQRDYHSDVDEANDWSGGTAGSNDLRQSAGDIQGALIFGDLRLIFKEYGISLCRSTGIDPPFVYDEDDLPIGLAAPNTLIKVWRYDYGFFLGSDLNAYLIRKDGAYFPVGDDITRRIRAWANDDKLRYAFSVYYPDIDQILLVLPSTSADGAYNDKILAFDLGYYMLTNGQEMVWSTPIDIGIDFTAGSLAKFRQPYSIGDLGDVSSDGTIGGLSGTIGSLYQEAAFSEIVLGDDNGYLYRFDDSLNYWDDTLISWTAIFKDLLLSGHRTNKFRFMEHELIFRNAKTALATCNIQVSTDGGENYNTAQSITLYDADGAEDEELVGTSWYDSFGRKHRIKLTGTYPCHLLGQMYYGSTEGRR